MALTSGSVVDGHVELQTSLHSSSSEERDCKWEDAELVDARLGPSSLVKM